ncbi:hypothetical protein AFERRI_600188 [Acidithiobacillus ferrivorans]|uniref:Uncharacterized protein n=1 Tax=Acidithiobacillus ferrivorans TaxID=160808 RepID=A0A060UTN9_9PROT|nr:hypothetical protein AFERRI_600188 [Acidithiobacillus ferrivorans]
MLCPVNFIHYYRGTVEPYPPEGPRMRQNPRPEAQTTKGVNRTPGGRLGCCRQAGAWPGWSLLRNEPSPRRWGLWRRRWPCGNLQAGG